TSMIVAMNLLGIAILWSARRRTAAAAAAAGPSELEAELQERARLVERQTRKSRVQPTWIAVAEVTEEVRLDVPLGKELLLATETRLPGGEELLVDLGVVEAGHRSAVEAEGARSQDQVGALQAGIALRGRFDEVGVAQKELLHAWALREQPGQLLIELQVVGDDDGDGRRHRLLDVARGQRRTQPFLGLLRPEKRQPRRGGVGAGRRPLEQVVEIPQRLIRDRPRLPFGVRARFAKECVQRGIVDGVAHTVASCVVKRGPCGRR